MVAVVKSPRATISSLQDTKDRVRGERCCGLFAVQRTCSTPAARLIHPLRTYLKKFNVFLFCFWVVMGLYKGM